MQTAICHNNSHNNINQLPLSQLRSDCLLLASTPQLRQHRDHTCVYLQSAVCHTTTTTITTTNNNHLPIGVKAVSGSTSPPPNQQLRQPGHHTCACMQFEQCHIPNNNNVNNNKHHHLPLSAKTQRSTSPSHSILTPGRPVPVLTL